MGDTCIVETEKEQQDDNNRNKTQHDQSRKYRTIVVETIKTVTGNSTDKRQAKKGISYGSKATSVGTSKQLRVVFPYVSPWTNCLPRTKPA